MIRRVSQRHGVFLRLAVLFLIALTWGSGPIGMASQEPEYPSLDPKVPIHQYVYEVWTTEDGLPSNTIRDIVQTRDGYLWLATHGGLVRFDGVRFTVFDPMNTSALQSTYVLTLCESRDGSLWIGSRGGGLTRYHNGLFSTYTTADGLASDDVEALMEDRAGVLWVVAGGQAHRFEDGRFSLFERPDEVGVGWVSSVVEGADGSFWLTTENDGLIRWQQDQWRVFTTSDGLPTNRWRFAYQSRTDALWVVALDPALLVQYSDGRFVVYSTDDGIVPSQVRALHQSRDGTLWIGNAEGLNRFLHGRFDTFTPTHPLTDHRFLALYEDREGSLWMGTYDGGLQRFKAGFIRTYSTADGLHSNQVMSVYEDRDENFWVGTDSDGLNRLENDRFVSQADISFPVRAIAEDHQGGLWLGTRDALFRYSEEGLTRYATERPVISVRQDQQGSVWVALTRGLRRFHDGAFAVVDEMNDSFVRWIHEDRRGVLWFGTNNSGLFRLEEERFTQITTADGLSSDRMVSYHEDDEGALWIGTEGRGVNRLKDGVITSYTSSDGLHDDSIWPILEDGRQNLWMGGDRGIFRVSKQELADFDEGRTTSISSFAYGIAEGMKSVEGVALGSPTGWKTSDGRLWFATMEGVAMIDPERLGEAPPSPPVVIEEIFADGVPIDWQINPLLPARPQNVEIFFTALSFLKPDAIRFQYTLEGYDQDWRDAGTRRTAYYTRIPPDSYRFRVRARHADGAWSEDATLGLTVLPAWWQTTWFRAIAALVALASVVGAYNLRVHNVERRNRHLQLEVAERKRAEEALQKSITEREKIAGTLQQQREQLAHFQRTATMSELTAALSHEINQPLTAIYNNADAALRFMKTDTPDLDELREVLIDIIKDDQRATEVIRNMRALLKKGPVATEPHDINEIVSEVLHMVRSDAIIKSVAVDLDLAEDLPPVLASRVQLQQVLLNLVTNSFDAMAEMPERDRSMELRTARYRGSDVLVSVRDTGPGLDTQDEEQLFAPFYSTKSEGLGMGLAITRSIVEATGGKIWAENNNGRGATFHIALPVVPNP